MSSAYGRLAAIRDYWMPRDTSARIEVRVTDLDEVLRELVRVITISAPQPAPAPLTDEQIDRITAKQWGRGLGAPYAAYRAYARAIEAAHGIGTPAKES